MKSNIRWLVAAACAGASMSTFAADKLDFISTLTQPEFRLLADDLGAALSYKTLSPASPLGITGFDLAVQATSVTPHNTAVFEKAAGNNGYGSLLLTSVRAQKGLPFGIDVGAMYAEAPQTNVKLTGFEVKYAIMEGTVATPALALRGTYTKLSGVDQLDLNTRGIEVEISQQLAIVTPYAGAGKVWTDAKAKGATLNNLGKESFDQNKLYLGAHVNLGLFDFTVEGDQTGDTNSYSARLGYRF